ncbi:POTRA domain-containing protein [Asaia bogorensis]|uniref:POTRA domain-containing protein n=1 Tax=Asaia bogorensis TaxID=91915 RepID=UPI0013C419B4|nr:POTRA domain-containing protein [Asaia bogorensis]
MAPHARVLPIASHDAYDPAVQNDPVQKDDNMKPNSRLALAGLALMAGTAALPCLPVTGLVSPASAASAPAADAPLTLKILKVEGNKAVSTDEIMAALPYHVGDTVTRDQLDAGVQKVADLYKAKNLGAKFSEKERFVKNTVQFYLVIEEQAPQAAAAPAPFVLDKVEFVGNKKVPTAELEAVTKLRPGATVTAEAATADTQAIQKVYQKHDLGVQIQPVATQPNHDNHVVLTYQITEK